MIKICVRCGCEFEANHGLTKYCAPCRHAVDCESDARYRATHPKASKPTNFSLTFKPKLRTCTSCGKKFEAVGSTKRCPELNVNGRKNFVDSKNATLNARFSRKLTRRRSKRLTIGRVKPPTATLTTAPIGL